MAPADVGWLEFTHCTARKVAGDDLTPGDPDIHTISLCRGHLRRKW
jgi:hypothetical protein